MVEEVPLIGDYPQLYLESICFESRIVYRNEDQKDLDIRLPGEDTFVVEDGFVG